MPILPVLKDFKKHPRKPGMLVHADNPSTSELKESITHSGSSWATIVHGLSYKQMNKTLSAKQKILLDSTMKP